MKKMPDIAAKAQAATKELPAPRAIADLSPAGRDRPERLSGVTAGDLKGNAAAASDEGTE
ncbi:hypothetical protein SAMN02927924_01113 [Sphingobium faniae]|nr:hypothetical protein SAMN02927924_01113 [Sphingobium faniae]